MALAAENAPQKKEIAMLPRTSVLSGVALALTLASATPALAQSSQCTSTFCVTFPSDWEARVRGGTLQLTDPTRTISFELRTVTQAAQFTQARREYEAELTARATEFAWETEPTPAQQHGMAGLVRRGRALLNGRPMRILMFGLGHASGGVVGAGVIVQGASQAQLDALTQVLNSIRPA
jgi:hypothetical protein